MGAARNRVSLNHPGIETSRKHSRAPTPGWYRRRSIRQAAGENSAFGMLLPARLAGSAIIRLSGANGVAVIYATNLYVKGVRRRQEGYGRRAKVSYSKGNCCCRVKLRQRRETGVRQPRHLASRKLPMQ